MSKNAIVTGASKGIGRAVALELAKLHYKVVLVSRSEKELGEVQEEILNLGGEAQVMVSDISDSEKCGSQLQQLLEDLPSVDLLVNNAGLGTFLPLEEFSLAEFDRVFNTSVKASFLFMKSLIPVMKKQGHGLIITIASDVSKRTFHRGSIYAASKYAQHALAETAKKELKGYGIRVSTIYPGMVDTSFGGSNPGSEERKDWLKPQDIATAVKYIEGAPRHVIIDEIVLHPVIQDY